MSGTKTAVWINSLGQKLLLDNRKLLLEYIDMTGTAGIHSTEGHIFADGQTTISHQLGAKTIPCSIAFNDRRHDDHMHDYLTEIFFPKLEGKLIVYSKQNRYEIDCYPQDFPSFKRDKAKHVWKFDVNFVADFPYWRKGSLQNILVSDIPTVNSNRILTSYCPFEIAPEIYLPESNASTHIQLYALGSTSKSFTVKAHENFPVRVKTLDFKVVNDNTGEDQNQLIDATVQLDEIRIKYGKNIVVASPIQGVRLQYYNLSNGEI